MKKASAVLFFVIFCFNIQAQDLAWDINFEKVNGRELESLPVSQIIRLVTGDIIQFSVMPASNAWCYVLFYDSQRQISILHDQQLSASQNRIFGPFELTEPAGTETIYVIIGLEKQTNLERLIREFNNNPGSRTSANNLYREIIGMQSSVSKLGEPASSYIPSGGTTRGTALKQNVTRFTGRDLYVRAITIRH